VKNRQEKMIQISSGAGHDAAVMSEITPTAMLFIRCKNAVSHHPDESVKLDDVRVALNVMNDFLIKLGDEKNGFAKTNYRQTR
jgi:allantoate deiminase